MNTKKIELEALTNEQLSWMVAKHICPTDDAVVSPALAVGGYHYDYAEPKATCEVCEILDEHKISVLWRPIEGQWWACVGGDPGDEWQMGRFGETRNQAAMRALVAHFEDMNGDSDSMVDLPEVLA